MIAPSYIFVTFFKMVFLVIILGALHGLFLLPVLLSLFGPGSCSKVVTIAQYLREETMRAGKTLFHPTCHTFEILTKQLYQIQVSKKSCKLVKF